MLERFVQHANVGLLVTVLLMSSQFVAYYRVASAIKAGIKARLCSTGNSSPWAAGGRGGSPWTSAHALCSNVIAPTIRADARYCSDACRKKARRALSPDKNDSQLSDTGAPGNVRARLRNPTNWESKTAPHKTDHFPDAVRWASWTTAHMRCARRT